MKRYSAYCTFLFFFLLIPFSRAEEISFAVDDWCPFICSTSSTNHTGIMIDIVKEVFEVEGKKIVFINMPLPRGVLEVRSNKIQGIIGVVHEVDPDFIFPEGPIYTTQFCFFTLPGKAWEFRGFDKKYSDIQIGLIGGKAINPNLNKAFPMQTTISGTDDVVLRLIKLLNAHRFDTFVDEKTVVEFTRKKNLLPPLRTAGCVDEKNEYVAFSPKNIRSKEYAELFSKGILKLKKSGRINQIVNRYLLNL